MKVLSLIIALLVISSCETNELPTRFSTIVIGIKDGDIIEVLFEKKIIKIRLADIDCPEKPQPLEIKPNNSHQNYALIKR